VAVCTYNRHYSRFRGATYDKATVAPSDVVGRSEQQGPEPAELVVSGYLDEMTAQRGFGFDQGPTRALEEMAR
jgi:hypothetical protein